MFPKTWPSFSVIFFTSYFSSIWFLCISIKTRYFQVSKCLKDGVAQPYGWCHFKLVTEDCPLSPGSLRSDGGVVSHSMISSGRANLPHSMSGRSGIILFYAGAALEQHIAKKTRQWALMYWDPFGYLKEQCRLSTFSPCVLNSFHLFLQIHALPFSTLLCTPRR